MPEMGILVLARPSPSSNVKIFKYFSSQEEFWSQLSTSQNNVVMKSNISYFGALIFIYRIICLDFVFMLLNEINLHPLR